ncbi:DNA primase [Microlunatus endophyticus]|uniref:DNA primase n=1 Tax=Microlunatus endophyticus TaxID=1716077 RepID=A0A917S7U0_9ACTN|nr:DNA primase [Microlunatus endophyticus]GGL63351.1 DNA primase [Microlunatus endophyticus]
MAGRINDEDIAAVRERARIEDVVGSYVMLRNAGGGSMKGLCPFHDESTPSFNVTPSRGLWYCFGACGEGGDVIAFMQKIENLSFTEAVQKLADRVGIQLRISDDGGPRLPAGLRVRLMDAHKATAEFYAEQLATPDALVARQFLAERGFDRAAAEEFGVGFAPRGGRRLAAHLKARGFDEQELITGGLLRRGGYDFFSGRLLWPIRDAGKSVIGFGARRIFDDDRLPAKYINTPETPLYKKSQVLYGLDLARTEIGRSGQAVIVEGYTDVMAAHLSGVRTAVASCGTAFGNDHARVLQRLVGDQGNGEVVFTFDGDAAGQAAALKVFSLDSAFITQTYVAIEPTGLDPCDLRLQHGDAAVRELIGRRVPLYRFVMTNILSRHDLDRADARVDALREAAPLVASVRDAGKVSGYVRELAGWLGMDPDEVRHEINRVASRSSARKPEPKRAGAASEAASSPASPQRRPAADVLPDPHDRTLLTERETAKLIIQVPQFLGDELAGLSTDDFTHPAYGAVLRHAQKAMADLPAGAGGDPFHDWPRRVAAVEDNPWVNSLVVSLAVEPLLTEKPSAAYVVAYTAKLRLLAVSRQIGKIKSRLQRTNPVEDPATYNKTFSELVVLEAQRKQLQNRSLGL